MDFLKEATQKLDVADKLPDQVKDKIPGQSSKRGKGEGEGAHLSKASARDDGGGFPNGLRPER